jgi:hypothetical protein
MASIERRLARLEMAHIRQLAAEAGAPHGFTADDILDEARRFFALPLEEQLAALEVVADELEDYQALRALILQGARP